ncbi:Integrator complex subunit 2 [Coemansia sp. RSA 2336]|nr:Integrator complex subunit 2 [Coemansia sp. RSA 2336]
MPHTSLAEESAAASQNVASSRSPFGELSDNDDDDDGEEEVIGSGSVAVADSSDMTNGHGGASLVAAGSFGADGSLSSSLLSTTGSSLVPASSLIPPSLQNATLGAALEDSKSEPRFNDDQPLVSPDDYADVANEARMHWISRRKQPAGVLEQSASDVRDFIAGSSRRRLRLVLTQLYDLLDKTPKIYELLELKRIVQNSTNAHARLDRSLNSLWGELKTKCSLLIVNKDIAQDAANQLSPEAPANFDRSQPVQSLQTLAASTLNEAVDACALLWNSLDTSIRGLVFIDGAKGVLEAALRSAPQSSKEVCKTVLSALLEAYPVLPDLYKVVIKGMVETLIVHDKLNASLVIAELHRHRVLPGAMFWMLASSLGSAAEIDEAVHVLDSLFNAGAAAWIGRRGSGSRPKYAASGDDIRKAIYLRHSQLSAAERQQLVGPYARVLAGLTGYLCLDVQAADYKFAHQLTEAAVDSNTLATCTALTMVLVGFGLDTTAQDTLDLLYFVANAGAVELVDCILVFLKTNHVKDVSRFISSTLGVDFAYPHERLFYLKDILSQTSMPFFSSANIAHRLLSRNISAFEQNAQQTVLYTDAMLYSLQSSLFQEAGVDVRPWICQVIRTATMSTANNLGSLLHSYVIALFGAAAITPIPEAFIWSAFAAERISASSNQCVPPAQVLCLLYIMHYYVKLVEQPKAMNSAFALSKKRTSLDSPLGNGSQLWHGSLGTAASRTNSANSQTPRSHTGSDRLGAVSKSHLSVRRGEYSDELLDMLPVSWILYNVGRNSSYQHLWPELLAMATAQFPDQLDVVSVLQRELAGTLKTASSYRLASKPFDFQSLVQQAQKLIGNFDHTHTTTRATLLSSLMQLLEAYAELPISVRMETCGRFAARLCQAAVEDAASSELTAQIRRAWHSLHALNPHRVAAATVGAWRSSLEQTKPKPVLQDIWLDPLVILRTDARVFRSADLTDILLTVLAESLIQSRTALRRIFALRHRENGALKKTHLNTIIQLQESGTIQLLIEAAMRVQNANVQWLLFEFIHARFLEQRVIQKLVHFQAYDVDAIESMVAHVPSMHACSEFIPELLLQSTPGLQLFAVRLATAIVAKYPIATNESMAKEVMLPHIQTTLVQISGTGIAEQLVVGNAMLRAVVAVGASFSPIREECVRLVNAVKDSLVDRAQSSLSAQQSSPLQKEHVGRWLATCKNVQQQQQQEPSLALGIGALHQAQTNANSGTAVVSNQKRPHSIMANDRMPHQQQQQQQQQQQAGKRDGKPALPGLSRAYGNTLPGLRISAKHPEPTTANGDSQAPITGAKTPPPPPPPLPLQQQPQQQQLPNAGQGHSDDFGSPPNGPGGVKRRNRHRSRGRDKRSRNISVERTNKDTSI